MGTEVNENDAVFLDEFVLEVMEQEKVSPRVQQVWFKAYGKKDKLWFEGEMKACAVRWSVVGSKTIGKPFVVYVCDWFQNKKPPPPAPVKLDEPTPKYSTGYLESWKPAEEISGEGRERVKSLIQSVIGGNRDGEKF